MIVRFGYVAISTLIENPAPSRTMTFTNFIKLVDHTEAIRKLERLALENLHNTLRILRHNLTHEIQVFRFSSKLIPLFGLPQLADWNPLPILNESFVEIGEFVKKHKMRVSFHPDHFTVLNSPNPTVLQNSIQDLKRHVSMLEAMNLDNQSKCNIHIGGAYGDKPTASERFAVRFIELEPRIQQQITLENDDKTFTALETLLLCETLQVPMVLDIHHDQVNPCEEKAGDLWSRVQGTWSATGLPPKIHVSSSRSAQEMRAHADYIDCSLLIDFMKDIASTTPELDVMLEAKMKDAALIRLMEDIILLDYDSIRIIDGASIEIRS